MENPKKTGVWSYRSTLSHSTYSREDRDGDVGLEKEREALAGCEIALKERLAGLNEAVEREEAKLMELERLGNERIKKGMEKLAGALQRSVVKGVLMRYYRKLEKYAPSPRYRPLAAATAASPTTALCHNLVININTPPRSETPPTPHHCIPISFYPRTDHTHDVLLILIDFHTGVCHGASSNGGHAQYTLGVDSCLPFFLRRFDLLYDETRVCVIPNTEDREGVGFAEMIGLVGGEGCVIYTPGELMSSMAGSKKCIVLNCSPSVLSAGAYFDSKLSLSTYTEVPYPLDRLHTSLASTIDHILYRSDLPPTTTSICFGLPSQSVRRLLPCDPVVYPTPASLLAAGLEYLQGTDMWSPTPTKRSGSEAIYF